MLKYMPLLGTLLLTAIILWVGISTWVGNRRKIRDALAGRTYLTITDGNLLLPENRVSICCNAPTFRPRWSADGWIASCQMCGEWQYLGDDYEHPPIDTLHTTVELSVDDQMSDKISRARDHFADLEKQLLGREVTSDDEGEPLPASMAHQPNVGGEGHPDYQGPHYLVEHDRFVPYDVIGDPPEGAAVHIVGNVACVGPLEDEKGTADEDDNRSS